MQMNELFLKNKKTEQALELLNSRRRLNITGLSSSRLSYFVGNILNRLDNHILMLIDDSLHLDQYYEDLIRLVPEERIMVYPEIEVLPHEQIVPDLPEIRERLLVLEELAFGHEPRMILTTANTLLRKIMPASYFKKLSICLERDQEINLKRLSRELALLGYERVGMVEQPAQFSIRGGIIDIYTITGKNPYRIELFGDEVDSIREFDPVTQRSENNLERTFITPARELILLPDNVRAGLLEMKEDFDRAIERLYNLGNREEATYLEEKKGEALEKLKEMVEFPGFEQYLPYFYDQPDTLLDYFDRETYLFFAETERGFQRIRAFSRELAETEATLLEQGSIVPSYAENFSSPEELYREIRGYPGLFFSTGTISNPLTEGLPEISFNSRGVEPYHGQLEMLADSLKELIARDYRVILTLNSASKGKRITEFLQDNNLPAVFTEEDFSRGKIMVTSGSLAEGFIIEDLKLAIYTEKEVIGKPQRKKRKIKELDEGVKISSLDELTVGDYVVHENHGIGKYLGVRTMEIRGSHQDYLVIKYSGEDKLYVPTEQVNLVQRYIGSEQAPPRLYKLGGSNWKKVKQRVKNSVQEMAIGLLELYAERETVDGYAYSEDTVWQKEFEEAFPYEETPDQLKAIEDVKADMEDNTPMDRLLCGDVGYGKTEIAIRAAFKAAMDGRQTAVLVPTTILAQQHFNTFRERMENYPLTVEMISRFKTPAEQREILKNLAAGKVDIVIGTHRLLSRDVLFNNLGLMIVDEEQRFGVTHKERLKDFKRNVDVLTLSATPIPRTLHMALVGVRDMSVIETPPENRYPIRTYIREYNRDLIRDAIRKEIGRQGQVYFVHNRVEDIDEKADLIKKLVPECRVAVAHGQMNEHHLERLMLNFYNREYDVLVCTTIIENGLDLSNVNTIIINRADQMGLAQLYQLRGRVGRSNRVAYAYLLYEKDRILPELAEKRLRAIKEFTNLGSGFKIAMRDLEIRGAGNLLGPEQHGHIAAVGFSLYCKLLENAVEELQGKKEETREVEVNLNVDAYLPEDYISDSRQKIEIYKRIISLEREDASLELIDEMIDRFGDPPEAVVNLVKVNRVRLKAMKVGISKITQEKGFIKCYFRDLEHLKGEAVFRLIDRFKHRIKVRSGQEPVIGIKTSGVKDSLQLLEKVLDNLQEQIEAFETT